MRSGADWRGDRRRFPVQPGALELTWRTAWLLMGNDDACWLTGSKLLLVVR